MFPRARTGTSPPLAPLIILLASLLLAGLLALISWRNYQHEENLRIRFLRQQGQTLIRSFEAGARTGMMMRWRDDALKTLVEETVRETEVAYIAIIDEQGTVKAAGGSWSANMSLPLAGALQAEELLIRSASDSMGEPVFEVSRQYRPRWAGRMGVTRRERMMAKTGRGNSTPVVQAIFVGLYTRELRQARLASLQQNLLLGGLLLLVGTAGFYLLFLAQRNRIADSTLETMELYTASLIEGMPAGLLSLDPAQRVVAVNAQTLEMLGRARLEVIGRTLFELVKDEALRQKVLASSDFIEQPFNWQTASGLALPLRISASRLTNNAGELLGTVLILRDMRELRAMEEQLERSRRHSALGVMATGVAHEIRNPLGTLRGFAQYFQRNTADQQARDYAGLMISEVDRLNRVISALLQFARPRAAELVPLETRRLCDRVNALMTDEADTRNINLRVDCEKAPEYFSGDFDLLLQMLLNLLQNGLEASSTGGEVVLQLRERDNLLEISVRDSGCGIEAEARSSIFDPFFTTRKSGTGLGLAIVSQVVEQHSGEIGVESVPGQGTEFIIKLPL
jgi:two-component system sensor histidine kinase HydH